MSHISIDPYYGFEGRMTEKQKKRLRDKFSPKHYDIYRDEYVVATANDYETALIIKLALEYNLNSAVN